MTSLVSYLQLLGYLALLLTSWSAIKGAFGHRDLRRLDILIVVMSLVLASPVGAAPFRGGLSVVPYATLFLFPYLLLRLVQHFRHVHVGFTVVGLTVPVVAAVLHSTTPLPWPAWQHFVASGYSIATLIALALTFSFESHRSAGVTARRLYFAAGGTWQLAAINVVSLTSGAWTINQESAALLNSALAAGTFICYYLAFATPRRLRKSWQRQELARYLVATADREADERGPHAADDLLRAAQRGVAGSAVFVAIRDSITTEEVIVRASTHNTLTGVRLDAESGPADAAYREAASTILPLSALDGRLRDGLARSGETVILAPISSAVQRWGVVGVVQRRGSLFPNDDLRLLEQLGQYAGGILDHGQLVTAARERERRAADRRLRETESRMTLMLDTITDYAILIVDHQGAIVNWPVGASAVFGYDESDVLDTPAAPLFGMSPESFLQTLAEAARVGGVAREHECTRHDGTRFFATTHIRRLDPGPDNLQGFVVVTRDITERRDLEDRLRQGQKMEALGRLAGGIAHDFNNLLTAILGYADWLYLELPVTDTARRDQVSEIQKAATRAAGLTRQLLAFSRHQVVQPVVLDISQSVQELMPMLQRVIGEHIDVSEETVGHVPPVLADLSQIEQVILNLAVNARDAMPNGGRLTIHISQVTLTRAQEHSGLGAGDWVRLDVRDTGTGMDAATQSRIFEPFFTTKEFGRGTGLGLATVYGIVRQMGGVIQVESTLGQGSTFSVYMRPTKLINIETGVVSEAAAPGGSETILLVEDEPGVAKLLHQMLQRHGYQVLVADGPARAEELAQAHGARIDLVVSDVVMPGGTGPELVTRLRESRPGLRALFISGYADSVFSKDGMPADTQFLQKPFTSIDLLIKVRHLLSGHTI
jgi:PAS domain S-box-containing protein